MVTMTICCRFRPLSSKEKRDIGDAVCVCCLDAETFVFKVHLIRLSSGGSELIREGLFSHTNEMWDLSSCPFDQRIFSIIYSTGEIAIWQILELYGQLNSPQLEKIASLDAHSGSYQLAIDLYIIDAFREELYESCKDVKFGIVNTRALNFIGAGAQNFKEWSAFIGRQAGPNVPGSPYAITFKSTALDSSGMKPMNVSTYLCADVSLGCSCGDCPSSIVCPRTTPPPQHEKTSCSIRIGSTKVKNYTCPGLVSNNRIT